MAREPLKSFIESAGVHAPLGLPRTIQSLCPECLKTSPATIYEEDGRVLMNKSCVEHGDFTDIVASHSDLFLKLERYAYEDSVHLENPITDDPSSCPTGCGLCPGHLSTPAMTNLDLTNRCNLRCPFCFANANVQSYVYEPSLEQIREMMDRTLSLKPRRLQAIQFSGGEPTLSPYFHDACRMAKERGIRMIQVATNGIRFARDPDFAAKAAEAGLNAAYLQFDGVGDEVYRITRGAKGLWEIKLKALEACRKAGIRVTLVPTIVRGVNDHQMGDIVKFAVENMDVIVGLSFQPVSFTGRIDQDQRMAQRYTVTDVAYDIEKQSGLLQAMQDWFPFSAIAPFVTAIDNVLGTDKFGYHSMHCNSHPDCGLSAYLLVNQRTGETLPLSRLFDLEKAFRMADVLASKTREHNSKLYGTAQFFNLLHKCYRPENAPKSLSFLQMVKTVDAISGKKLLGMAKKFRYEWRLLLLASMHFMDAYNYQVDRVKRCTILYSTPAGRLYPFCTYNSGHVFREDVEKRYSIPKVEWLKRHGGRYVTEGFME
ncbi:MAG: radical SAM protein [Acidobacteriota bacterium]